MSKFANLDGLHNFRKKLNSLAISSETISKILSKILNRIAKISIEYAQRFFNKGTVEFYPEYYKNGVRIFAEGDEIAYVEFGTGELGNGSYEGQLPENQISFYSSRFGRDIVLDYGWTYSYANKIDETKPTWEGFEAQAPMWKTAQHMREVIPQIIREVLKSEGIY